MSGLARWIGIAAVIGVIAAVGFVFRDRLSSNADNLQVGDCFQVPTDAGSTIEDVQHQPCIESHTGEVFFIGDHPAPDGAPVLTRDDLIQFVQGTCLPALDAYTGTDVVAGGRYDISGIYPTDEDWANGEREFTCYAVLLDGGTMTSSIKAAQ